MRPLRHLLLLLIAVLTSSPAFAQTLMHWPDLLGRPMPSTALHYTYGNGAHQFAELWQPQGAGPFPVVVMLHGGCWRSRVANLTIMNYLAEDLRQHGVAVWNVEYRGEDEDGGGYPGTFLDVARGTDALRNVAAEHHLRLSRIVAFGHSAGGHLAAWIAARSRLPRNSPLFIADPLPIS